jgi:hypothetical protein
LERLLSLRVFNSDSQLEAVLGELAVLSNEFHLVFPHPLLNPLAHHLFHHGPPLPGSETVNVNWVRFL